MEDKFEREIEDILSRLDKFPSRGPSYRARHAVTSGFSALLLGLRQKLASLSVARVMFTGIILIFVGYFFRSALPGLWTYVISAGLVFFFAAFFISLLGGRRPRGSGGGQIFWRGRPASAYSSAEPSVAERLLMWWRRHLRRRY